MGSIYKISCDCGYEKQLNIGGGIASCSLSTVNRMFSDEELKEFNSYYKNNKVKSFFVENELAFCNKCKEIMTVAVLRVELISNEKIQIVSKCLICSNEVQILGDSVVCPKCGQEITKEDIGDWD